MVMASTFVYGLKAGVGEVLLESQALVTPGSPAGLLSHLPLPLTAYVI